MSDTGMQGTSPHTLATIRAGDREAFLAELQRDIHGLYKFVARELRYHEALGDIDPGEVEPEDILDDVALRALRNTRSLPRRVSFKGWMRHLALRVIHETIRGLRSKHHVEVLSLEDPVLSGQKWGAWYQPDAVLTWEDVLPAPVPTPEDTLLLNETRTELEKVLNSLPPDQRMVFILHAIEGLSYAEIAAMLHWPRERVKAIHHVARDMLRQKFNGRFLAPHASPPQEVSQPPKTNPTVKQVHNG